ncbi:hypothetical protein ACQ4LE_009931 [Meloidogyne hapla]|uniref:CGG triplet repeat-binding protein 1 n=1 Tax=Meloidogyne hapla TaxID=6305 RepID=A0A1I8BW71_MELHA
MAPTKSRAAWLREWITRVGGNSIYTTDGKVIFCEACQQKVFFDNKSLFLINQQQAPSGQFFQLNQHNSTEKHQANVERRNKKQIREKQQFLTKDRTNIPDKFTFDLCNAMISANIPFQKIFGNTRDDDS